MMAVGHGDVTSVALQFGAKQNELVRAGQYWRLVTPIFLHANWIHLLVNAFSLYQLGSQVEQIYGRRKYLALFLFAGIAGNLLSFALGPPLSLGASGALFGLVGAGIVFPIRFRDLVPSEARRSIVTQLTWIVVINLALGYWLRDFVDNWCHIGGLIGGAFLALFVIPDVLASEWQSTGSKIALNALVAGCVGLVLVSWLLQWKWAVQHPPAERIAMVTYYPGEGPQWRSLQLPLRWQYSKGSWTSKDGAAISARDLLINDVAARPDLQATIASHVPFNTELDGRPGWYSATPTRQQYRIPIFNRIFELTLDGNGKPLRPSAIRDFAIVASSVRFIRPPFVTHPVAKP
jgi:rhomboid protease GluP